MNRKLALKFGKRVREERERLKLSQEGLAALCSLHRTYVGGIERGERNPTLHIISRLAKALGVSMASLLDFGDM